MRQWLNSLILVGICLLGMPLLSNISSVSAQNTSQTLLQGRVIDAQTGESMPFVQIEFVGSQIGTTSDIDGYFTLSTTKGYTLVSFSMIGYKTYRKSVRRGSTNKNMVIEIEPDMYALDEVVIHPPKKQEHYKRKGNPAVELLKNVIAHRDSNRLVKESSFRVQQYEKLTFALDPFDFDLNKNRTARSFKVLEKYVDTTELDTTPYMNLSLRETIKDIYNVNGKRSEKTVVTAKHWEGMDEFFDNGGLSSNIQYMFQPVDIYDNNIELVLNKFISPISTTMANAYYHYYIMDTIMVDGYECIDLAFVPVNSESWAFTGHLYITNDSTYALRKYVMAVPPAINMNWVNRIKITQTYKQLPTGHWVEDKNVTEVNFALYKKMKHTIYGKQTRIGMDYEIGALAPDSLFGPMSGNEATLKNASKYKRADWEGMRPIPLGKTETLHGPFIDDLTSIPLIRTAIVAYNLVMEEYIPTTRDLLFDNSKWDFGPFFTLYSYNGVEGSRLRIGGMTTANVSPHWFFRGYAAYGFKDKRPKGSAALIYSFNPKEYHPQESLRHALYLTGSYDLEVPGHSYGIIGRDHIFMSVDPGAWRDPTKWNRRMWYVAKAQLKYEKEWPNRFSVIAYTEYENTEATGDLSFLRFNADGSRTDVGFYQSWNTALQLRYSPGAPIYNNRMGVESVFNLAKNAPIFRLNHELSYMFPDRESRGLLINKTDFSAEYRFYLSSFGYIDARLDAGIVWNQKNVPYPKLYMPKTNRAIFLNPKAFNMMQTMEFLMDKYVQVNLSYHMKGMIFNRIPLIKKLQLREVVSFAALWGDLSKGNNPDTEREGLYAFPIEGQTRAMSWRRAPYMELSVGIENIFKFVRIEYIRRLNYNNEPGNPLGPWDKNGIKFTFSTTI